MKNNIKVLLLFAVLIITAYTTIEKSPVKHKSLVKAYIAARNNYDFEKINALIGDNYKETFLDGTVEIKDKKQLFEHLTWAKELDSKITLLEIRSEGSSILTLEENSNYLDLALQRKKRKFKIVYTIENNKIQHQIIDTLKGYGQVLKFNAERYKEFSEYCDRHGLKYTSDSFGQEFGVHLRGVLEQYKRDREK